MKGRALQPMAWKMRGGGIFHFSGPLIEKSHPYSLAWQPPPPPASLYVEVVSEEGADLIARKKLAGNVGVTFPRC